MTMQLDMLWSFLVISKEKWTDIRKARKQLLYQALAKRPDVNQITYVNRHRYWWRERLNKKGEKGLEKIRVWELYLPFPGERWEWVRVLNRNLIGKRLNCFWREEGKKVVFFYHPWDVPTIKTFKEKALVIFDWTEDWISFYGDREIAKWQQMALEISDGVVTVTHELYSRAKDYNSKLLLLPNASALPIQEVPFAEDPRLVQLRHPRIGYIGHVGPWFDGQLVNELSNLLKNCEFILIGGVSDKWEKILVGKNIKFLGTVSLQELPGLLSSMDVLIAPYIESFSGDATKIYDYFTTGKPIVSSFIPSSERFRHVVTFVPRDVYAWQSAILQAINEKETSLRLARLEEAKLHTWRVRASQLVVWLSSFF